MARFFALLFIVFFSSVLHAGPDNFPEVRSLKRYLNLPDERIDFGLVKLTFDKFIDPSFHPGVVNRQLDQMVEHINNMAKDIAMRKEVKNTDTLKLLALRTFLFDAGDWNNNQTYSYDREDPLGQNAKNKLLHNYLKTRKGNCVSMPVLMLVLGQRMGLNIGLAKAPLHYLGPVYTNRFTPAVKHFFVQQGRANAV